ncbi:AIR synthase related protein, partial [Desulfocurvibacter africanus]|uniref:AIR synthase related protein n=1 Tax=Desulfocurvibacter africanus TaxID=873 RepID=UPI002FDA78A3
MQWRVEVATRPGVADTRGRSLPGEIRNALGMAVESARVVKVYTVDGVDEAQIGTVLDKAVLHDPVLHAASRTPLAASLDWDWLLEVGFRPGVTDNEGRTAKSSVALVLGFTPEQAKGLAVYTARQYLFKGALSREQVEHIGKDLLANELIECIEVRSRQEGPITDPRASQVKGRSVDEVAVIPLSTMSDEQMLAFSRENTLALSLEEMRAIRAYYGRPEVRAARAKQGLPAEPTDAEVEALAQTWSEHCKHKIFQARIRYDNRENGQQYEIDSLFKTFIAGSTKAIRAAKGKDDLCLSVFKDNAGVFKFDENVSVCIKVETHNSPSALDPYGGALTGIVGVNRDPMGTGMGANLVCNTDVFCFASPFHEGELPPRLLHPRRVLQGV